jgi:5-methylcytosine-specific restriction endonuclease McrA
MPADSFRKGQSVCVWCQFGSIEKRAKARYADKRRQATKWPITLTKEEFVEWYCRQKDECSYCGVTYSELKQLKLKNRGGYYVSWDIDRIDSSRPYEKGNLALSCFLCNTAKGNHLSEEEAKIVGAAIRKILRARLK